IVIGGTRFAPATVVVLTTFEPIASAQNPLLCHGLSNGAQPAQDLPRAINIIHAPSSIPLAIVFLGGDQIPNRALYARIVLVEVDVTEKLKCPRRQIAASRIQNRVVIGEGHIFKPAVNQILVESGPAAIATLKFSCQAKARWNKFS